MIYCAAETVLLCHFVKLDTFTFKVCCSSLYGCEICDLDNRNLSDLCVVWRKGLRRVRRLSNDARCDLLCMLSDSIQLEDEITCRFMNFVFGRMRYNYTFVSTVVRSAFTEMNSPIGKNLRLCALKYGICEGDAGCWRFFGECFVRGFISLPQEIFVWRILCARPMLYVRACWCLVRTTLHHRRNNFLLYYTIEYIARYYRLCY